MISMAPVPIGTTSTMELHVLTALVLICSVLVTPDLADCHEKNARIVMRVPEEFASPVTCAMHGQAYVAETAIGRSLGESDRIKVVCRHRPAADEAPIADLEPRDERGRHGGFMVDED